MMAAARAQRLLALLGLLNGSAALDNGLVQTPCTRPLPVSALSHLPSAPAEPAAAALTLEPPCR